MDVWSNNENRELIKNEYIRIRMVMLSLSQCQESRRIFVKFWDYESGDRILGENFCGYECAIKCGDSIFSRTQRRIH